MSRYSNILLEREDLIATVSVHRPQALNALNHETLLELQLVLEELSKDETVRAVIVTGTGERAFVAGADIKELMILDAQTAKETSQLGQEVFNSIENFPKPVIAAVNGFCLGGGCELALACHIRIASENAKLGQPEVKLGLIPGYGGTQRLPRLVGKGLALEMILSGEMISASDAKEIGLVNRVVEADELMSTCRKLAEKIISNGPVALEYSLKAVICGLEMPVAGGLAMESALFGLCSSTEDMKEGTGAFVEKRKPEFKGK
jgi:enoyl-CoA hydratase